MPNFEHEMTYVKEMAKEHGTADRSGRSRPLRLEEDNRILIEAYRITNEVIKSKAGIIPAAEWLLDNFYLLEEQFKDLMYNITKGFYKDLPILNKGKYSGFPRIYAMAAEMVKLFDGRINDEAIVDFVGAYQSVTPLSSKELWTFPMMLRVCLLKRIKDIAVYISDTIALQKQADEWAEKLMDSLTKSRENPELRDEFRSKIAEHEAAVGMIKPVYAERLLQKLREEGLDTAPIIRWLDGKLAVQNTDADELIHLVHQNQASNQSSMGNAITSLRHVSIMKWEDLYEELSHLDRILRQDPAAIYPIMDFASRDEYRHGIEYIARKYRLDELSVAEMALDCARENKENSQRKFSHIGYYILDKGKKHLESKIRGRNSSHSLDYFNFVFYFGSIGFLTVSALVFFLYGVWYTSSHNVSIWGMLLTGVLSFLPLFSIVIGLVNWIAVRIRRPVLIPKLEFKDGIPEVYRTMVVIPTLLTSENRVIELIEQMEVLYLANQEDNLHFALIGDYKDGPEEKTENDNVIVETAIRLIDELNKRHSHERQDVFYFFHRYRQWNANQGAWMGWERKRGALVEFNELLAGSKNTSFFIQVGDLSILDKITYVITLDADTQLPRDAAKKLIGAMAHPLNEPILNAKGTRVVEGYGLLQPRIGISVDSASRSFFSLTFSGQTGIDPYTTAVSDVYQDLFQEGIFTGKGIYNPSIFNKVLSDSIPDNSILSHDLLEGSYVRAGLVTDVELIDGYPAHYMGYSLRLHRWVRGDWQLLPWLASRVRNKNGEIVENPLNAVSKWKILDNMRRSLLSPALYLIIVLSFFFLPGSTLLWLTLAIFTALFPLVTDLIGKLVSRKQGQHYHRGLSYLFDGTKSLSVQIGLTFVFLAHQAYIMLDAVIRSIWRVTISRRFMLEWVTAADSDRRFRGEILDYWQKMRQSFLLSIAFFIIVVLVNPSLWYYSLVVTISWALAPLIAYKVSRPKTRRMPILSQEQIFEIRKIARKTWKYFDDFVNEEENWLPPDNYQLDPPVGAAHRTSPTNIGLHLMSVLAARDLGYIGTLDALGRIENTIKTMTKLEKWKGHYYNWYNTVTLEPLKPLYVSTVDNGNLIGYLMTLIKGIEELLERPIIGKENITGLRDVLAVDCEKKDLEHQSLLNMLLYSESDSLIEWQMLLDDLKGQGDDLDQLIASYDMEMSQFIPWSRLLQDIPAPLLNEKGTYKKAAEKMIVLLNKLTGPISLQYLYDHYLDILRSLSEVIASLNRDASKSTGYSQARKWLKEMEIALTESHSSVKAFFHRCHRLIRELETIIEEMDFSLLYDEKRELFSIGYNVEEGQLSESYYDLLASEARQASFIAIAKGDIPQKHWFKLGRPLALVDGLRGLVSWSGTMFEYLMPVLIMKSYENTLLDETYGAVVRGQKQYAEQYRLPWGISESGFYAFDLHLNYQYKAFGIPQLGLKRGLVNDMVVAPYASVLALPVEPLMAYRNMEDLMADGLEGPYGLFEAIDYTPERLPKEKKSIIIKSFMAHHQGMILIAIDNYLNNNIMQSRFHSLPMVKATELLLQERIPRREVYINEYEDKDLPDLDEGRKYQEIQARRVFHTHDTIMPETALLSNGNYTVMLTNSGGGYSQYMGQVVSRWREDVTKDDWGMMFYITNLNSNNYWSAAYHPAGIVPKDYKVIFEPDKVTFSRRDGNIETQMEVVVSPEFNGEVRKILLTNHSNSGRMMETTSYFELVLAHFDADLAHPAFSNLFVQTEFLPEFNTLLATRRPREKKQKTLWLFHTVIVEGETVGNLQYETDRSKFIGRGRSLKNPQALDPEFPLSETTGAVLDPIMSLRRRIYIPPGETVRISYITGVAENRESVVNLARDCQNSNAPSRTMELAWTHSQVELKYLNITAGQANLFQTLASQIIYNKPRDPWQQEMISSNRKGQRALWTYGISGDLPIIVVRVSSMEHMELVRQMLTSHEYMRLKGLIVDLVVLNEYGNSYEQPINDRLRELIAVSHARDLVDKNGGIFVRQISNITDQDLCLLFATARLVLNGDKGSIAEQLSLEYKREEVFLLNPDGVKYSDDRDEEIQPPENLWFQNDTGGFTADGREYVIFLKNDAVTPLPWSNIIANHDFGFLVTESGSGYTWCKNSRENKLTPWSNDPVRDPSGEVLYVRDDETGEYWTITPLPFRQSKQYLIRHGQGYSIYEHSSHGLFQKQTMFVPLDDPVKLIKVSLKNNTDRSRKLSLFYYVEWVLGINRDRDSRFVVSKFSERANCMLAHNRYNEEFGNRTAFVSSSLRIQSHTSDRMEFIGRNGSLEEPASMIAKSLSNNTEAGFDPCSVIQVEVEIQAGEEKHILFCLGQGEDDNHVREISDRYTNLEYGDHALEKVKSFWDDKLGILQVTTPDPSMDLMLNRWLLYQTLACRVMARTGFYQAGGAYGFRDQLQDVMALIYCVPDRAREQILLSAAHQFPEGDVQHWWHPPYRGVRTRITDDLLFLPFVTADYIEGTGDWTILDEQIAFINMEPLSPEEHDRYAEAEVTEDKTCLYDHCVRAIERAMKFGSHGMPLMGGGDWNDGMDKVGIEGQGESVWLGWFLYTVLNRFLPICKARNDEARLERYKITAERLLASIEQNAWDGGWYRRAYFDDGTPLGSEKNEECRIDSISQSWSVISGGGRPERIQAAMRSVQNYLVDEDAGLIKLLAPPFSHSDLEPGYIKGYLPGVRENGGQYTHAAVWTIMAFARMGEGNRAWRLYHLINPINHTRTCLGVSKYKAEPYVMAADVYAVSPHTGRGGWTWYTGSSGWMYRVGIGEILGFARKTEYFTMNPCIPEDWTGFSIKYRYGKTIYYIEVTNPNKVQSGIVKVTLDGRQISNKIPLLDDGKEHQVIVTMGIRS